MALATLQDNALIFLARSPSHSTNQTAIAYIHHQKSTAKARKTAKKFDRAEREGGG